LTCPRAKDANEKLRYAAAKSWRQRTKSRSKTRSDRLLLRHGGKEFKGKIYPRISVEKTTDSTTEQEIAVDLSPQTKENSI
jgi:hypothetical protein